LSDDDRQLYIDKFESLVFLCFYEIARIKWTYDSVAPPPNWRRQHDHRNLLANDVNPHIHIGS